MKKYIILLPFFLNSIVIADLQKDNEYRNIIQNFNLNIIRGIDEKFQKRIDRVNKWLISDIQCDNLSRIAAKFIGNVEDYTAGLEPVPKLRLKFRNSVMQKYKTLMNKIEFWYSISYFPISLYMLQKHVTEAEQLKKRIIKLQNEKLSNYLTLIQNRVKKIHHIPLGPKLIDQLFQNATLILKSNTQVHIIRDSLKSLIECFDFVTLNKQHKIFYKYAKRVLDTINEYDYYNLKHNVYQYNLLADYEIRNRILNDVKLTKITTDLCNLKMLYNSSDSYDDDYDDDYDKSILFEEKIIENNYEELKIPKNFDHFVFQVKESINSIEYEIINNKCKIDEIYFIDSIDQRKHVHKNLIDEKSINILKNRTRNIEKNCQRIKDLNNCTRDIIRLGESIKVLVSQTVISKYNELIKEILEDSTEDEFEDSSEEKFDYFEVECLTGNQSNLINCLRSVTRLNKALELFEDGKQCLNAFGLQVNDDFQLSNIPVDFNVYINNTRTQKNISAIIAQERIYQQIFKNIQLKLNF